MKLIDILTTANANLLRSKTRTVLTVVSIFIGAFTITLTVGITSGVSSYIDTQVGSIGAEDLLLIQPKIELQTGSGPQKYNPDSKSVSAQSAIVNSSFNSADIDKLAEQEGIYDVKPLQLVAVEYAEGPNGEKYQLRVQPAIDSLNIELAAGSKPDNNASKPQILIPVDYVQSFGFNSSQEAVGKTLTVANPTPAGAVETVDAVISGVQEKSLFSQGGASVNDTLINSLLEIQTEGLPPELSERYMGAYARFDDSMTSDELAAIQAKLADAGYDAKTLDDQLGIVMQVINAITAVLIFFGAIALLAASFGIVNTLFMSVQERTKEIGLMKAMGMSRSKVFALFSVEAILIGLWGSLAGIVVAVGLGYGVVNKIASDSFLKDLPGFELMVFPIPSLAVIALIVMTIAFLSGTLPARRAAKLDPIDALRYE